MQRTFPIRGARLLALVTLLGAGLAVAEEPELVPDFGGSTESVQPPATPARTSPSPTHTDWPCRFGPITMRIESATVNAIIQTTSTRREAWYAVLALEDDPQVAPLTFELASDDDGLGDGLVCPE